MFPIKKTVKTVYPCSNGRFFATFVTCGRTKFVGTFNSEKEASKAVLIALNGISPKKTVCYY